MTCKCQPDECVKGVDSPEHCIYRLDGEVAMGECEKCQGWAWHLNDQCLNCKRMAKYEGMWPGTKR